MHPLRPYVTRGLAKIDDVRDAALLLVVWGVVVGGGGGLGGNPTPLSHAKNITSPPPKTPKPTTGAVRVRRPQGAGGDALPGAAVPRRGVSIFTPVTPAPPPLVGSTAVLQ